MKKVPLLLALLCLAGTIRAEEVDMPLPIRNVMPGQWISVRMFTLFGHAEQKQSVMAVDGEGDERLVTIRTEISVDGETVDTGEDTITLARAIQEQMDAVGDFENVRYSATTAEVKGQRIDAVRIDFIQNGQAGSVILSEAVPISGLIRLEMESVDEPILEIIDYGEAE